MFPKPKKKAKTKWQQAYWDAVQQKKKNKFGANRTKHAGMSFASQLEADVYDLLCLRMAGGEICSLRCQEHVYLTEARILYIPDFTYFDRRLGETVWAEAKGFETASWRIKLRLWKFYGPGRLFIHRSGNPKAEVEEIRPKL